MFVSNNATQCLATLKNPSSVTNVPTNPSFCDKTLVQVTPNCCYSAEYQCDATCRECCCSEGSYSDSIGSISDFDTSSQEVPVCTKGQMAHKGGHTKDVLQSIKTGGSVIPSLQFNRPRYVASDKYVQILSYNILNTYNAPIIYTFKTTYFHMVILV